MLIIIAVVIVEVDVVGVVMVVVMAVVKVVALAVSGEAAYPVGKLSWTPLPAKENVSKNNGILSYWWITLKKDQIENPAIRSVKPML